VHIEGKLRSLESLGIGVTITTTFIIFIQPFADKVIS